MKETATGDISVSGPNLAQHAFRAGLVDDVHLFVFPLIVGGGKPGCRDVQVALELLEERRFGNGVDHLHHRPMSLDVSIEPTDNGRLAGKTAIVVGAGPDAGAHDRQRRATAIRFAAAGAEVLLVDVDPISVNEPRR